MKKMLTSLSLAAIALNAPLSVFAEDVKVEESKASETKETPEERLKRAEKEAQKSFLRLLATERFGVVLDLGDAEYLKEVAKSINKVWVERIEKLDFELKAQEKEKLLYYLNMNKSTFIKIALTGNIPTKIWDDLVKIVPALKGASAADKDYILLYGGEVIQRMVFQSLVDLGIKFGSMTGNNNSQVFIQVEGKVLNLNAIKVGKYILHDIHTEIKAGYAETGIGLISGKLAFASSPKFSFTGKLLAYTRDFRRQSHNTEIVGLGMEYQITPYLLVHGSASTGYRTYDQGYVDYIMGLRSNIGDKRKVHGTIDATVTYQDNYSRANNVRGELKGKVSVPVKQRTDQSYFSLNLDAISEVEYNSNPGPKANDIQWFNGFGISGTF